MAHHVADLAPTAEQRQVVVGNHQQLSDLAEAFRPHYYVNCWNMAEDENVAMWDRYGNVAVTSTYRLLCEQMHPQQLLNLGVVRYIDYDQTTLPSLNIMHR